MRIHICEGTNVNSGLFFLGIFSWRVQLFPEIKNFIVIPQLHFTQVLLSFFTLFFIKNLRTSLSKVVSLELYLPPTYFCHYCKIFGHSRRQLRFCFFVVWWNFQKYFFKLLRSQWCSSP